MAGIKEDISEIPADHLGCQNTVPVLEFFFVLLDIHNRHAQSIAVIVVLIRLRFFSFAKITAYLQTGVKSTRYLGICALFLF